MTFKQVLAYFLTGATVLSVTATALAAEDPLHGGKDGAADGQAQVSRAERAQTADRPSQKG